MSCGGACSSYPRRHPAQILMLGVSSFRETGLVCGDASTRIDVEGPHATIIMMCCRMCYWWSLRGSYALDWWWPL